MSEISEAPLYIDDSPNLTMMEIRAKARRLRQKANLKLIVVDYMQLMTSGKKHESRQVEVSEFSRHLKLLAKELEVPVIAISQLNRGPEQRTDKKPMLSDLRESGCLTAATRILRADTGAEVTFGELMRTGERPLVWSLDERLRMVARPMTNVFPSGRKEVFRLRLASGCELEATGNHPFMKLEGWTPLEELKVGDRIATPRRVPEPVDTQRMDESELIACSHDRRRVLRQEATDPLCVRGRGEPRRRDVVCRAFRRDRGSRRLSRGPGDNTAVAVTGSPGAWATQSDRRLVGWLRVVREAQLRKVCVESRIPCAQRSGGVVPASPVGDGWVRTVGCKGWSRANLLRVDKPTIGRRCGAVAAPARRPEPD